jgi:hypothetical protein
MREAPKRALFVATSAAVAVVMSAAAVPHAGRRPVGDVMASISALLSNQPAPGAFRGAVVGLAQEPVSRPGLGDGVQLLQADLAVPDEVVLNTRNV